MTTYLEDMRDFSRYNAEFKKHFDGCVIARTTIQVAAAICVRVEMETIIYKPLD